ncbi:hypothetical protein pdam_00021832, partial [Pocillopora damicornis]
MKAPLILPQNFSIELPPPDKTASATFAPQPSVSDTVDEVFPTDSSKKDRTEQYAYHVFDSQQSRHLHHRLVCQERKPENPKENPLAKPKNHPNFCHNKSTIKPSSQLGKLSTLTRFCTECKSKVLRAYSILAGDLDGPSEKGYCATLYDGLKSCPQDRHVHVLCDTDYIAHLIGRAEPELAGGYAILVLTCLGIHLWERLHRLWQKLRAEEQTWQMLFYLGVAVEEKQGISRLEQVVEEISEAERAKELRREQKRLKKKARRKEKCKCGTHLTISAANNELKTEETAKNEEELEEEEVCVNEIVEETRDMNGHGDSCEDDEDDGDSGGSPCSCEDLSNSERSKSKKSGFRNGDC